MKRYHFRLKAKKLGRNIYFVSAILIVLALMPTIAAAQFYSDVKNNGELRLSGYGSFFIQGEPIEITGLQSGRPPTAGQRMMNQMYVQFMKPQPKKGKKHEPIVFIHGGGLTAKTWQTTPDGRMGWDEYFVRQGFNTYLVDQLGRGRSGFDGRTYNDVRGGALEPSKQPPILLLSTDQSAWGSSFRWGITPCTVSPCWATTKPHPDIKFPMQTVGVGNKGANLQFYNQGVPDLNATLPHSAPPGCTGQACAPPDPAGFYETPSQMAELAKQLDGAVLVTHSQSSGFATRAALQKASGCYPWKSAAACKVKGMIQIETGCFDNLTKAEIDTLKHIPLLVIDGDYFTDQRPPATCVTMMKQINDAGGDMKYAVLPGLKPGSLYKGSPGPFFGNDHMMMMNTNNLKIADMLIGWINSRGL